MHRYENLQIILPPADITIPGNRKDRWAIISAEPRLPVADNGGDYTVFTDLTYPVLGSVRYK
jgi:hypothetical protein